MTPEERAKEAAEAAAKRKRDDAKVKYDAKVRAEKAVNRFLGRKK